MKRKRDTQQSLQHGYAEVAAPDEARPGSAGLPHDPLAYAKSIGYSDQEIRLSLTARAR